MRTEPAYNRFAGLLALLLFATACATPTQQSDPELQAQVEGFALTVTARATSAGEAQATMESAQAQATQHSQVSRATQTASLVESDEAAQATQAAAAPVLAELPIYEVDPQAGKLAWLHPPVTLDLDGFRQGDFANQYATVAAADFALAADITWDTQYGASACGFLLRSNGEPDATDGYLVALSRNANGHLYFAALAEGKPVNYRNAYINAIDPAFEWANGSTNRLAVVARGEILSVYSNYTLVTEIDTSQPPPDLPDIPEPPKKPEIPGGKVINNLSDELKLDYETKLQAYREELEAYKQMAAEIKNAHNAALNAYFETDSVYEQGFPGLFAFNYSGTTTCSFSDAWLWILE